MPYKFNPFTGKLDNAPGAPVFPDNKFTVFDDGDKTRRFQFQASGISPATTRTLDIQDVDGPVAIGYGAANQYIRGDATLANFPVAAGGGSSVSYYLNGSVNQGTFAGETHYQLNKTAVIGAGTNFSLTGANTTTYFITDSADPSLLQIPQGNFNFQLYASTSGGSPTLQVALYKYDGVSFTQIGNNSIAIPVTSTVEDIYLLTVSVPATTLLVTDRLAVRVIGGSFGGNTITLYTEGDNLGQMITTFSTGMAALNGLTDQVQFLATGTAGTNFNIVSSAATHTFNIPTASAVNRGALSSADWTTFNNKIGAGLYTATTGLTMNADRLLGRTTAGVGAAEEITVGTGLSLTAGTLSNTALGVTSVTATAPITSSGGTTPDISTSIATNKIVGRSTAGTGVMEELTPVGITVSGGNITGIGGTVGTVDNAVPRADSTGGYTVQGSDIVIDDATTSTQANVAITNQHAGETNSALVLTPKGTGAFILGPTPDGTITGGNARGAGAVDLSRVRASATEVASGVDSFAAGRRARASGKESVSIGGQNIASGTNSIAISYVGTASGDSSFVGGGRANQATGDCSAVVGGGVSISSNDGNRATAAASATLGGNRASADRAGMHAHAMGQFSAIGDAQRARFVLRNKTTTNAAVELFLDGSSARLTIPSGKIFAFTINISGVKSDGSAVAHYLRQYCFQEHFRHHHRSLRSGDYRFR
jgi:hypothetical protein